MEEFDTVDVLVGSPACGSVACCFSDAGMGGLMNMYDHGGDIFGIARRNGVNPDSLIDFSASINPLGMPAGARNAIIEAVDRVLHYPEPYAGPLRKALADYHDIAPGEVIPANGSTELIFLVPRLVEGRRALIVAPAFSEYAKSLSAAGWQVHHHILSPDDYFELKTAALKPLVAAGCDLLFLCNPGNPTGRLYSRGEVRELAELCRDTGTFLVLDEAFMDFCGEDASFVHDMVSEGKGLVLRSLTKFYAMPGLRLGYAAASSVICERLAEIMGPWSVNSLAQAAGSSALQDSGYRERSREFVARERALLFDRLAEVHGLHPFAGAANYLLVRSEADLDVNDICRQLLVRHGMLVRSCSSFEGLGKGFFRVAVRSGPENLALVAALKEVVEEPLLPKPEL